MVRLILAVAQEAPASHSEWLTNLSFFLNLMTVLIVLWAKISGKSEKREVRMVGDFVGKPEFDAFKIENKEEHDHMFSKLGGVERGVNGRLDAQFEKLHSQLREDLLRNAEGGERRAEKIHNRINPIEGQMEGLKASVGALNTAVAHINVKIDRAFERVTGRHAA